MNHTRCLRHLLLFLLILVPWPAVSAQDGPDHVTMLAEALRARSAGNLETAEERLTRLAALAPGDTNIRALLESVRADIARRERGEAPRFQTAAPAPSPARTGAGAPPDLDRLVQEESERLRARAAETGQPAGAQPSRQTHRGAADLPDIDDVSPGFARGQEQIADLLRRGRAQFIA